MEALNPRWLSIELNDVNREVDRWNSGRAPFINSLGQNLSQNNHTNHITNASDQPVGRNNAA